MATHLDRLPVEIFAMIFQYMPNCDVIWSFYNISPYLNAVLNSHSWPTLNFRSISKCRFDFICHHLPLQRIISITLSDDFNTPDQVRLFFSRSNLRSFINLRSLTLLSVTNEDIYPILADLSQLEYLVSLVTTCRSVQPLFLGQTLNQMKSLQHLSISHGDIFDHNVTFPLHQLKVLDVGTCEFLELRRLQTVVPSLVSIKIILQANHQLQLLSDVDVWSGLERFHLTLNDKATTTFQEMQKLLSRFHHLTHLTLNICGSVDAIADGTRWETSSTIISLRKFDFIFQFAQSMIPSTDVVDRIFHSFSTYFWCELKRWYVIITAYNVYTISYFDDQLCIPSTSVPISTAPDHHWFHSKVKRIKLDEYSPPRHLHHFRNLQKLDLSEESILLSIRNINQFTHLQHLILHRPISNSILGAILTHNSHINHLTLSQIDFHQLSPLETIHDLCLQKSIKFSNQTQIKAFCRVFPSVQRLAIHLDSPSFICQLINGCHRLENGIFHFYKIFKPISREWLEGNTHLNETTCSFTCRNEPNRFLIWINRSTASGGAHSKDRSLKTSNMIHERRSDKCSLQ